MDDLVRKVEEEFCERYSHFKEFQTDETFRPLWDMCIDTVRNHDNMIIMIFCNDVYQIPPVRVFIDLNRDKLDALLHAGSSALFMDDQRLKTYAKQCLGAFWGMVFKFGLGYSDRRSVSVVQKGYYGVATASRFVRNSGESVS